MSEFLQAREHQSWVYSQSGYLHILWGRVVLGAEGLALQSWGDWLP